MFFVYLFISLSIIALVMVTVSEYISNAYHNHAHDIETRRKIDEQDKRRKKKQC